MGYFNDNNVEYVAAKVTNYGRKKISEGDFNIKYFQIGDSEFDYSYDTINQKILLPMDMNLFIKHPYQISVSGTTYGVPTKANETYTIKNFIGSGACGQYSGETWSACLVEGESIFASSKLFFGYTSSLGQIDNNTTVYLDGGIFKTLLPEDQEKIVILFYNPSSGATLTSKYKYDDYIYPDYEYFKVKVNYTNNEFKMDTREIYINSTSEGSKHNRFKFRYLLNSDNHKIGKIFVDNRIIVFDNLSVIDEEFLSLSPNVVVDFDGTIDLVRATDIQVMRYLITLPNGQFTTTQNPTYVDGKTKKITEVSLLDENKEVVVIGKLTQPLDREATQVISVKIDF